MCVEKTTERVAIIDLGSNTARLIVMLARPGYSYRLVDEIREVVRLRQGMTADGIGTDAIKRALSTLQLFYRFCANNRVDAIIPVATSAVREAKNGPAFVERVSREIGLSLRVLDGEQEAYYGALGVLNEVPLDDGFVLDIGGGSVQLSEISSGRFIHGCALPLGSLSLSERFVRHDPITADEIKSIEEEIARHLNQLPWAHSDNSRPLVGLGGTIRNLAWMDWARCRYPLGTLHGYTLDDRSINESIDLFKSLPLIKRSRLPGLKSDRADIILPGTLVLRAVMERLGLDKLTISVSGLREGIFFERFWQDHDYPVAPDIRRFSVLNLARYYGYLGDHITHMQTLTTSLFKQLQPLHNLDATSLDLLRAAAMLHDIGSIIGYERHHHHSQTLIEFNGLPGYKPQEIALIALLTRFHRKGKPGLDKFARVMENGDLYRLRWLSSILRLAEYLERGRSGDVHSVSTGWDADALTISLHADEYPLVELWQSKRYAVPLLEAISGRKVQLVARPISPDA